MVHLPDLTKLVLIVEDDHLIRISIEEVLAGEGYKTHGVSNGKEALDFLKNVKDLPSAIVLDIMMPVMDGWSFRAEQQQDNSISNIPVVVITADGNAQDKARRMAAQGWVRKPIEIDALITEVGKVIAFA